MTETNANACDAPTNGGDVRPSPSFHCGGAFGGASYAGLGFGGASYGGFVFGGASYGGLAFGGASYGGFAFGGASYGRPVGFELCATSLKKNHDNKPAHKQQNTRRLTAMTARRMARDWSRLR